MPARYPGACCSVDTLHPYSSERKYLPAIGDSPNGDEPAPPLGGTGSAGGSTQFRCASSAVAMPCSPRAFGWNGAAEFCGTRPSTQRVPLLLHASLPIDGV